MNSDKVLEKVKELAKNHPSNVYVSPDDDCDVGNGCYYSKGECTEYGTGCIVGQALKELELADDETLNRYEGETAMNLVIELVDEYDDKQLKMIDFVQTNQDSGMSWGRAWDEAAELMTDSFHYIVDEIE